ncbi:uncharacterized protein METZ01_LOCUS334883, partial [marine metagenome]
HPRGTCERQGKALRTGRNLARQALQVGQEESRRGGGQRAL